MKDCGQTLSPQDTVAAQPDSEAHEGAVPAKLLQLRLCRVLPRLLLMTRVLSKTNGGSAAATEQRLNSPTYLELRKRRHRIITESGATTASRCRKVDFQSKRTHMSLECQNSNGTALTADAEQRHGKASIFGAYGQAAAKTTF